MVGLGQGHGAREDRSSGPGDSAGKGLEEGTAVLTQSPIGVCVGSAGLCLVLAYSSIGQALGDV